MTAVPMPIPPGLAPGGWWCRLVCDDCGVLDEHSLSETEPDLEGRARTDGAVAWSHHWATGHTVRNHIYNGDTGACIVTAVVG